MKRKGKTGMSIITANLKLYSPFHSRKHIFLYSVLLFAAVYDVFQGFTHNIVTENLYFPEFNNMFSIYFFFLGVYISKVQADILTKPFSVCMPGHSGIPLKIIFLSGIITSIIFSIPVFIIYPEGLNSFIKITTIFLRGMSIFLLGSYAGTRPDAEYTKYMIGGIVLMLPFEIITDGLWDYIGASRESFIVFHSLPLVILTMLLAIALTKKLGKPDFIKNFARNGSSSFLAQDNPFDYDMHQTEQAIKKMPYDNSDESRLDEYFHSIIKKAADFSIKKYLASGLFCMLDRRRTLDRYSYLLPGTLKLAIQSMILFTFLTLTLRVGGGFARFLNTLIFFVLIFSCYFICNTFKPIHSHHLLPITRKYYFKKIFFLWLIKPVLLISWLYVITAFSIIFTYTLGGPLLSGNRLAYISSMNSYILWILTIIPLIDTCFFYFRKPYSSITMTIIVVTIISLCIYSLTTSGTTYSLASLFLATLISNVSFIVRLRRYWLKEDLAQLN